MTRLAFFAGSTAAMLFVGAASLAQEYQADEGQLEQPVKHLRLNSVCRKQPGRDIATELSAQLIYLLSISPLEVEI